MGIVEVLVKSIAGLMLIIMGSLIPSAILIPKTELPLSIVNLQSTFQISGLLISSLVFGSRCGAIAAISYITIGLLYLPVFHGGGSIGYLLTPDFGYLLSFIPAAWICGTLVERKKSLNIFQLTSYSIIGILIIQILGLTNLIIGTITGRWQYDLLELIILYGLAPFSSQLILSPFIGLTSKSIRYILIMK